MNYNFYNFLINDEPVDAFAVKDIWSSTSCSTDDSDAWAFDFAYPFEPMTCIDKQEVSIYFQPKVRAVRGGSCRANGDWCIDQNDCAEGMYCDDDSDQCVECLEDAHCPIGSGCVSGVCVEDIFPALTAGPYLAAGTWPVLPNIA